MTEKRVRACLRVVLIAWVILLTIVSLSSVNRSRLGLQASGPSNRISTRHRHRLAHFVAFGGLTFLLALLTRRLATRISALVAVIALGSLIELGQHKIYSIPVETGDIRDDCYGALAGLLAGTSFISVSRKRNARSTR
jgi:hypothetical protein